jgi:hypothetical protein
MTHVPSSTLHERIARLERDNRRFKLAAGASTALLFVWTACGVAPRAAETLAAERFVLTGPDGVEHGSLELDAQGNPYLVLKKEQTTVVLTTNGPGVLLRGSDGKTGAFMGIDSRNTSKIELSSARILDGVRLSVRPDGSAGVYVLDGTGRERGALESLSVGGSNLSFRDDQGRIRAQIGIDPANLPNLLLLDPRGTRRMGMIVQDDGNPLFEIEDDRGRPRAQLTTAFDGAPRLELLREDGAASFAAP